MKHLDCCSVVGRAQQHETRDQAVDNNVEFTTLLRLLRAIQASPAGPTGATAAHSPAAAIIVQQRYGTLGTEVICMDFCIIKHVYSVFRGTTEMLTYGYAVKKNVQKLINIIIALS